MALDPLLRLALQAVERAFGADWLSRSANQGGARHDVKPAWRKAREWLAEAEAGRAPEFRQADEAMWELLDMGKALHGTQQLDGFNHAIQTKLLRQSDWRNHIYVAQVALWALDAGYEVAFLRTRKGRRTADLELRRESRTFHLECKHKSPFMRRAPSADAWRDLSDALLDWASKLETSADFSIACVGKLDRASLPDFVEAAQSSIRTMGSPVRAGPYGAVIATSPLPHPQASAGSAGLWLPAVSEHASATGTIKVSNGVPSMGAVHRVFLFEVGGHNAAQLRDSIVTARGQPDEAPGIIYIRIDDTHLPRDEREIYTKAIESFLLTEIGSPENSQIAAIVLTGAVQRILSKKDKSQFLIERLAFGAVSHALLPRGWALPLLPLSLPASQPIANDGQPPA